MKTILLPVLALAITAPLAAQTAAPKTTAPRPTPFDNADANRDGKVSRAEFVNARSARFDKFDRNRDGVISKADFPQSANHQQALAALDAQIASADSNKDGSVSRAELSTATTPFFDKFDTDHDGFVTRTEVQAARAAAKPPSGQRR